MTPGDELVVKVSLLDYELSANSVTIRLSTRIPGNIGNPFLEEMPMDVVLKKVKGGEGLYEGTVTLHVKSWGICSRRT